MAKDYNFDLDTLLPVEIIKIGSTDIPIRPLSFIKYQVIGKQLKSILAELREAGVDLSKLNDPESIVTVVSILLEKFPSILEEVTDISIDSLNTLPLDVIVDIAYRVLDINLKSKDSLIKNWKSLISIVEK